MTQHPGQLSEAQEIVAGILAQHAGREGPLLPILHDIQERLGHVPASVVDQIAQALVVSRAEVHGVLEFYHDFRATPAGRHSVKICRAEACQAVGADAIGDHARDRLGLDWHQTDGDGRVTLEPVFCLGLCACGPAAMVDGQLHARLDAAKLDKILGGLK